MPMGMCSLENFNQSAIESVYTILAETHLLERRRPPKPARSEPANIVLLGPVPRHPHHPDT